MGGGFLSYGTEKLSLVSFVPLGNVCTSSSIFCTFLTRGGGGGGGGGQKMVSRKCPILTALDRSQSSSNKPEGLL